MACRYNLGRLKILVFLFALTLGSFMFSGNMWPAAKLHLSTQWIYSPIRLDPIRNISCLTTSRDQISENVRISEGSTSTTPLPFNIELLNTTKIPGLDEELKPLVHFRELFDKEYSSTINTGTDNMSDSAGYLIYRCDTHSMRGCGGWADRTKGMMAAYVIANLTGRIFKTEMLLPSCDIQQFIMPNQVNWTLPVSFHKFITIGPDVQSINYVDNVYFWNRVKHLDLLAIPEMKAKYVYYKSNLDYMAQFQVSTRYKKQLSWMKGLTRAQINAVIFKRLFKLSPQLHGKLNAFFADNLSPSDQLVCAHVRIGRNPSLPHDTVDRVREEDLPKVWNFFRNLTKEPSYKIFLMSDSENVISSSKRQSFKDKMIFTSGNIVHVERSPGFTNEEICVGLEKVILEQFILMHCDILLISKSGLSRMSSYVRGSDKGLYCLMDGGRILPCQGRNIQELYGVMG